MNGSSTHIHVVIKDARQSDRRYERSLLIRRRALKLLLVVALGVAAYYALPYIAEGTLKAAWWLSTPLVRFMP